MRRWLALAVSGLLAGASGAGAADMPGRMADDGLPFMPLFAWAGTTIGVNAGYGSNSNRHTPACFGPAGGCPPLARLATDRDGFVGGGQIGYQLQVGRYVGGFEADFQYADLGRATAAPGLAASQRLDFLGTFRARLGIAADRFLLYVTGGLAYGDVTVRQAVATVPGPLVAGRSRMEAGFSAGGGLEYGLADNVTVRAEGLYYDLGTSRVAAAGGGVLTGARFETQGVLARAAVNYKFSLF